MPEQRQTRRREEKGAGNGPGITSTNTNATLLELLEPPRYLREYFLLWERGIECVCASCREHCFLYHHGKLHMNEGIYTNYALRVWDTDVCVSCLPLYLSIYHVNEYARRGELELERWISRTEFAEKFISSTLWVDTAGMRS